MQLLKNRYFAEGRLLTLNFNNACSEKKGHYVELLNFPFLVA